MQDIEIVPLSIEPPRIGTITNGAGIALVTCDLVHLHGGSATNFLDLGGNVTEAKAREAIRLVAQDARIEGILVNCFGGIDHCDVMARGLVEGLALIELRVPLVVRMQGTRAEEAHAILRTHPAIRSEPDLDMAVAAIVELAQIRSLAAAMRRAGAQQTLAR